MDGMAGMEAGGGHEHVHNHSAHAAASPGMAATPGMEDMGKFMSSVGRNPDGSYFYYHGAFTGHVVPGAFFLFWGLWWAILTYSHYFQCLASNRRFQTRGWQLLPFGPLRLRSVPLEPFVKLVLPVVGILGELWLGHESFRSLYQSNGMFLTDHLNDWQHSTMYLAFMASGLVDLLGYYLGAPPRTELAFLSLSFLSEGLLLVFHLKGPRVEVMVHLILVLQVFSTVVAIIAEMAAPSSILMASARPWLTMLQGIWWIQTAYIMYTGAPQWDPDYMGSGMMVPVPFVLWTLGVAFFMFCLMLIIKGITEWRLGRKLTLDGSAGGASDAPHLHAPLPVEEPEGPDAEVELSGMPLKMYAPHTHQV